MTRLHGDQTMSEGVLPLAHTQDLDVALQLAVRAFDIERFAYLPESARGKNGEPVEFAVRRFTTDKVSSKSLSVRVRVSSCDSTCCDEHHPIAREADRIADAAFGKVDESL